MKTGRIEISAELLDRVRSLPFFQNQHLDQQKYENLGYDIHCLNRHEQFGTRDAIQAGLDWSWTEPLLPEGWKDVGLQFDRAYSGYCVPPHQDHYEFYRRRFQHDRAQIRRRLVFLEPWQSGHYFQVNDSVFVQWRQGDWVEFGPSDIHLGGNLGPTTRYTLQITGVEG